MLTNLGKERADVSQLAAIWRARWTVEIQFRHGSNRSTSAKPRDRKSGEHHLQALVPAGMIAHQLGMRIARKIGSKVGRAKLSYGKIDDLLAVRLIIPRDLAKLAAFDPDPRHLERDKGTSWNQSSWPQPDANDCRPYRRRISMRRDARTGSPPGRSRNPPAFVPPGSLPNLIAAAIPCCPTWKTSSRRRSGS